MRSRIQTRPQLTTVSNIVSVTVGTIRRLPQSPFPLRIMPADWMLSQSDERRNRMRPPKSQERRGRDIIKDDASRRLWPRLGSVGWCKERRALRQRYGDAEAVSSRSAGGKVWVPQSCAAARQTAAMRNNNAMRRGAIFSRGGSEIAGREELSLVPRAALPLDVITTTSQEFV